MCTKKNKTTKKLTVLRHSNQNRCVLKYFWCLYVPLKKKNIYLFYDGIKTKFCIGTLVKDIHETNAYCVTLNLDFFFF